MNKKKKFGKKVEQYDEGGDVVSGQAQADKRIDWRQSLYPADKSSPEQGATPTQQKLNDWAQAVADHSPESENVRDMRGNPNYAPGDDSATTWGQRLSDTWQRLQEPFDPRKSFRLPGYQQGGEVLSDAPPDLPVAGQQYAMDWSRRGQPESNLAETERAAGMGLSARGGASSAPLPTVHDRTAMELENVLTQHAQGNLSSREVQN